jgi:hypothetical protein
MVELPLGQIDAYGSRTELGQRDRPLRSATAEFEDVLSRDVAEDPQLSFGDLGHAPGKPGALGQLIAVTVLIGIALGVPEGLVLCLVMRECGRGGRVALVHRGRFATNASDSSARSRH